jgi:hypothetical protein
MATNGTYPTTPPSAIICKCRPLRPRCSPSSIRFPLLATPCPRISPAVSSEGLSDAELTMMCLSSAFDCMLTVSGVVIFDFWSKKPFASFAFSGPPYIEWRPPPATSPSNSSMSSPRPSQPILPCREEYTSCRPAWLIGIEQGFTWLFKGGIYASLSKYLWCLGDNSGARSHFKRTTHPCRIRSSYLGG